MISNNLVDGVSITAIGGAYWWCGCHRPPFRRSTVRVGIGLVIIGALLVLDGILSGPP